MKRILYFFGTFVAIIPSLAIFSEGEIWVNFAGIVYILAWCAFTKYTKAGRRLLLKVYRNLN